MQASRQQRKAETRQRLMDAATAELAAGRSFDTLSLREVSKLAGIAPTSFYRHFHDMEALGLALLDQNRDSLLHLMHDVREQASRGRSLIRASVETVFDHISGNQGMSRMVLQESRSRESTFRDAAMELFDTMSSDLAEFLVWDAGERGVPIDHPRLAANSIMAILFAAGIALLDSPADIREKHIEATIIQLRMIMRGAEAMGQTK